MELTFYGAARTVTGSCFCLETNGKRILIDCGLYQGREERDNRVLGFAADSIDYVIVTHAHIDHSGRIPLLEKEGFHGEILATRLTGQLLNIMLRDSAHIQESDAQWETRKAERAGRGPVEPLYTMRDAEAALERIVTYEYHEAVDLCPGVSLHFVDAGHLLGSASVEMKITEKGITRRILFSGDIGNLDKPVICDPEFVDQADYVVVESTYGDRIHEPPKDYTDALAEIIDDTLSKGGNVVIPAFAVGRTQELLYAIREIKERGLVEKVPDFCVCVDSPLAIEATTIFAGDLTGYMDEEAIEIMRGGGRLFNFPGLKLTYSSEESKALNTDPTPKLIISASGMADAGRIRHHLKHNLWRPESTVVFVGFQAEGTLGRRLLNGVDKIKLFGEEVAVRARIANIEGMSSHADRDLLLKWVGNICPAPREVFVVHGECGISELFAQTLRDTGLSAHAPMYKEVFDLATGRMLNPGIEIEPVRPRERVSVSASFLKLEDMGRVLLEVIQRNKGGTNKDLKRFSKEVRELAERWDI